MLQRRRWLTVSMLTIAAVIAAAATPAPLAAQAPKEVEVALIVPLSGPWARQGVLERMGAEMAIDDKVGRHQVARRGEDEAHHP